MSVILSRLSWGKWPLKLLLKLLLKGTGVPTLGRKEEEEASGEGWAGGFPARMYQTDARLYFISSVSGAGSGTSELKISI
jgi:hypothetical protein